MSNARAGNASDAVLTAVGQVRGTLSRIFWARMLLQAGGAGMVSWLLLLFLQHAPGVTRGLSMLAATAASLMVAIACFLLLWRRFGHVSPLRAALWIEEHGDSGYALVTWVEQSLGVSPLSPSLGHVVAGASRAAFERARPALMPLARAQLAGPLLFALGAALVAWRSARAPESWPAAATKSRSSATTPAERAVPIGPWRLRVTPPAYSGLPAQQLGDVNSVRALSGARIELIGSDAVPDSVRVRVISDSVTGTQIARVAPASDGWRSEVVATGGPLEVRVSRERFAKLLLVEGVADSIPRVTLTAPVRDSVLRRAVGRLPLVALMHDDIGLARASFEVVISSGEGERFTARTVQVGARTLRAEHDDTLRAALDLAALQLGPGDVVHMRAIVRDAHPMAGREPGTSETRSFRVARPSEYDSVAVEPAPPPEVDKSLLSQRMLLMLTEKLEKRRPRLAVSVLREESRTLARDQARLRQAVGDAVFQRLTGDAGGEHSHSADDGHDHGVEAVGGKLALSGVNAQGMLEEGDDSPVIAINKPLLEAYNAMWDAGRALEQAEPRAAIPFMRIALEAIERARAASRLYLRGRPPTVIIDLAKVRLVGKDTGAPDARTARLATPSRSAAREARLLAAASLVPVDPGAARDSLAVLRIESLADAPAFAQALASLLEQFSQGKPVDITEPFLRARRVLGGVERVPGYAVVARRATVTAEPFVFATAQYDSGDWDSAPMVPANVIDAIARYTSLPVAPQGVVVPLGSEAAFQYPLLFLTGHLPVRFTTREADVLRRYLTRGGMLFVDDHNHDVDGAFHKTIREEITRVAGTLAPLPNNHPLYRAFFVFDHGPPTTSHEMNGWGDNLVHEHLDAVLSGGRIAVLYSSKDYSSEWSYHPDNKRFLSVDNTKFAVNVVVYALTR